jgi:predicted anti-sigma-YlaC factor YlaD
VPVPFCDLGINMIEVNCPPIRDLLVDYADGEVSQPDADRVASHLEGCPDCRAELRLLQESLKLAQAVWAEAAGDCPTCHPTKMGLSPSQRWRLRWTVAALAASIVLALMSLPWLMQRAGPARIAQQTPTPRVMATSSVTESARMSVAEIERYLAREAAAARLTAAAELLGTQPGLEEHRQRAERYIIETYADTAAAQELSARTSPKPTKEPQS